MYVYIYATFNFKKKKIPKLIKMKFKPSNDKIHDTIIVLKFYERIRIEFICFNFLLKNVFMYSKNKKLWFCVYSELYEK